MAIVFSLKAVPMFKVEDQAQKYAIKEMFSFESGKKILDSNGIVRPEFCSDGVVDQDIIDQNKDKYGAFKAYYDKNQDKLNAAALKAPGTHIMVEDLMAEEKKASVKESPKKISVSKVEVKKDDHKEHK